MLKINCVSLYVQTISLPDDFLLFSAWAPPSAGRAELELNDIGTGVKFKYSYLWICVNRKIFLHMTLEKLLNVLKLKTKVVIGPEGYIYSNRQNAAGDRHRQQYAIMYLVSHLIYSLDQLLLAQIKFPLPIPIHGLQDSMAQGLFQGTSGIKYSFWME